MAHPARRGPAAGRGCPAPDALGDVDAAVGDVDAAAVARLAAGYSAAARAYHRVWAPVLAAMAQPLLQRLPLAASTRVLDIGTGSGSLVPALRDAAPQAWLLGIDRADGMLQLARRVLPCAAMDARRLALRPQSFDVAVMAYLLFHCPRPVDALREAHRVLRAGGTIGVVTWGACGPMPGTLAWTEALDALGAAHPLHDPAVAQHASMNTPGKLAALLHDAGFATVRAQADDFRFAWSAERLLAIHAHCGPAAARLAMLPAPRRAECRRRVREHLAQLDEAQRRVRLQVVSAVGCTTQPAAPGQRHRDAYRPSARLTS